MARINPFDPRTAQQAQDRKDQSLREELAELDETIEQIGGDIMASLGSLIKDDDNEPIEVQIINAKALASRLAHFRNVIQGEVEGRRRGGNTNTDVNNGNGNTGTQPTTGTDTGRRSRRLGTQPTADTSRGGSFIKDTPSEPAKPRGGAHATPKPARELFDKARHALTGN